MVNTARFVSRLPVVAALGLALGGALASAYGEEIFRVDFEHGLKATGTNGGEPQGSSGGGFEILKEGSEKLQGATVTEAFPAQGKRCLQLGHHIVWKVGINDRSPAQLSFWILPVVLPSNGEREIVWGGDHAKPHQTFWMKLRPDGRIAANYWSWQKQDWLPGVVSDTAIKPREWSLVTFAWGPKGQRLFINGRLAGGNQDTAPPSWVFDLKFGIHPMYLDDIRVATTEEVAPVPPEARPWQPSGAVKAVFDLIDGAEKLAAAAPKGSDAFCRGLIIQYAAKQNLHLVMWEPMSALTAANLAWMKQALAQTKPQWRPGETPVPPFDASKRIEIKDGRMLQDGQPTFLLGNYSPTPVDAEIGFNFCGALMPGPNYAFPSPVATGDTGVAIAKSIDQAQAGNKVIDVLLSLGIPGWTSQLGKHVGEGGCGWFPYNIEDYAVRAMFKAAADIAVPNMKGHGTNVIINLANEPAASGYSPNTTAPYWKSWLMVKHGTVANLNRAWGTHYKDFMEAEGPRTIKAEGVGCADPGGIDVPTDPKDLPQWYDWCLFNQQRYANFMQEIRDNMERHKPGFRYTVKWLSNMTGWWKSIGYGLNPYDVMQVTDFGGCDSWTFFYGRDSKAYWALDFNAWYDLAKSIAPDKPILNSEDHLIRGFDPADQSLKFGTYVDVMPWQYFYTAVYRQLVHGQGGGEYWTYWEGDKGYNLNERAYALDAMSQVARDARRQAREISAIANQPPKVAVLLSSAALAWNPKEHVEAEVQSYNALTQLGVPVGYMLEEMLPDGALARYQLLVVPQAKHISKAMNAAITRFAALGRTVVVVGDVPAADEYGQPLMFTPAAAVWAELKPLPKATKEAFDAMHPDSLSSDDANTRKIQLKLGAVLKEKALLGPVQAAVNGELPYGLEWRAVSLDGKLVTSVINYTTKPFVVELTTAGAAPLRAVNVLDGQKMRGTLRLAPMGVALLRQQ